MLMSYEFVAGWLRASLGASARGASLVEYALLIVLIALACVLAITSLGRQTKTRFESVEGF